VSWLSGSVAERDYVAVNRAGWTRSNAEYTDRAAHDTWAQEEITWGQWSKPEREVQILPDVTGKDVVEVGCGTAYFGAWLKRAGARRVVGIDVTPAQLETARRMDEEFGLGLELIEANAEDVPLPDDSFDVAFSEYGASIWCDPALWIAEAARLLRPGGELVFLVNSVFVMLCYPEDENEPPGERLLRPYFGMYRFEWPQDESVEFHLPHGKLIALLRESGFEVEELIEIQPPEGSTTRFPGMSLEWSRRWPLEEAWRARKRS